jgi:hypothetical protein
MLEGGCFCRFVRYRAEGTPFHESVCHCTMCRRITGAPMVAWFSVPRSAFHIVAGEPVAFRSSGHATRSHCPRCGTHLTFADDNFPNEIDVTMASLDDPNTLRPKDHLDVGTKLPWVELCDGLPQFETTREG